ncbi:N-6 DNA methylase [Maribacter dokdonensis]|uniref:N-6 DNA methylase n=1 Tax=Maribacter dokdonensis TaxID=320912 RepID=UPI0021D47124|nr:N-6 DNA methylase [Maribacter dokdonensis]
MVVFGIVLSNSIASIAEWENIRKWLIERVRIVGLFDLPANTFGETGVATTVIIAYKPKSSEKYLLDADYEVFIKEVENIGYEVKTVKRTITFKPQFLINEETFEHTSKLEEDFSTMQDEFKEFLKRQELEIKNAFNFKIS